MNTIPDISKSEFDVLRILWKNKALSIREVHNSLPKVYSWAYTTTKTTMDRMVKKELLLKENFHGVNIYKPNISRPKGLFRWVQFTADRVLEMSYGDVVSLFAKNNTLSDEEIKELEKLLEEE